MNYAITPEGTIVEVGDKAIVKGYEVFSDTQTLRDAIAANRIAHFKKYNPFVHAKKLWGSLPQRPGYKADLAGFEQVMQAIARLTFAAHRPKRVQLSEAATEAGVVLTEKGRAKAARDSSAAPAAAKKTSHKAREIPARIVTSKKSLVIELLKTGCTRAKIQEATVSEDMPNGWQPHTVRGFLSTLGKVHKINVRKDPSGDRVYSIEE